MNNENLSYTVKSETNTCQVINEIFCIYEAKNVNLGTRWCQKGKDIDNCFECPERKPEKQVSTLTWTD